MPSLNNKNNSIFIAETFRNSLDINSVYFYVSKSFSWNSEKYFGLATDASPPSPNGSVLEEREIAETLIGAKRILPQNVVFACKNNLWTSGTIYDMYRDDYSPTVPSATGAISLENALYFVITVDLRVYMCLYTPGSPSTVKPNSTTTANIVNSDGYVWKYLYSMDADTFNLYSTGSYIPCFVDPTVSNFALANSGAVSIAVIPDRTTTNVPGTYFTKILGDGTDGVCKFVVNSTSLTTGLITTAEVFRKGSGYNTAYVDLSNCKDSLANLQNNTGTTYSIPGALIKIIVPPYIGHGYDPIRDLGASTLIIVKQIVPLDAPIIPTNSEYRIIGLLENPLNANNELLTQSIISGCDRVIFQSNVTTNYTVGELVRQGNSVARVISWDSTNKILYYYKNQYIDNLNYSRFSGNTAIIGQTSSTSLIPNIGNSLNVNSIKFVNGYAYADIKRYTGSINFINFTTPTIRSPAQVETLKLVIEF